MSKLSPLGQSMASLFTPESARLRAGQRNAGSAGGASGANRIPGYQAVKSDKSGDSLGNPNGPGYEFWGKKKPGEAVSKEEARIERSPSGTKIETSKQGPEIIRLSAGWERLLLTQKKLCEKARGLFSVLEGPQKYIEKKKLLQLKSRGCIVDLDLQQTHDRQKAQEEAEEEALKGA